MVLLVQSKNRGNVDLAGLSGKNKMIKILISPVCFFFFFVDLSSVILTFSALQHDRSS